MSSHLDFDYRALVGYEENLWFLKQNSKLNMRSQLNWIERWSTEPKVGGSTPSGRTKKSECSFFMQRDKEPAILLEFIRVICVRLPLDAPRRADALFLYRGTKSQQSFSNLFGILNFYFFILHISLFRICFEIKIKKEEIRIMIDSLLETFVVSVIIKNILYDKAIFLL